MDLFRFWFFVHDGGSCSQALGPEPELSGKIISHDVVWKKITSINFQPFYAFHIQGLVYILFEMWHQKDEYNNLDFWYWKLWCHFACTKKQRGTGLVKSKGKLLLREG